jgi:vacuolar protein sorting-associated protein 13A/C
MDIFGNPVHLLEGVGSGIYQLFNEPRKGLLKGPEEFGIGLTRGARALVSNVVGGGFNTVSKITGTLLTATKNISSMGTEEEVVIKEEEKPKGFFSGALSGFKKGIGELTHGVTGIVTKPIEESKKGGVGGFFKGVGTGLVGAVMAPVNTFLTVGNEVSSGISNSEFISNKKSLRRFRLPRTLYKYLPISPYNEIKEIERKKQRDKIKGSKYIVISLGNEKLYLENSTEIIMCSKLSNLTNLVFTNVMIKILDKDCIKLIEKVYICDIKDKKENNNDIELILKNDSRINFKFKDVKNKDSFITNINKYLN